MKWYELKYLNIKQHSVSNKRQEKKKKKEYILKIILIGKSIVKEMFLNKNISRAFRESMKLTIGADFYVKYIMVDGKKVFLRLWDFAEEERFKILLPAFTKGINGAIFMCDIANIKSLKNISDYIEIVRNNSGDVPIFLAFSELFSKGKELVDLGENYIFTDITSKIGPRGENTLALLTEKILKTIE